MSDAVRHEEIGGGHKPHYDAGGIQQNRDEADRPMSAAMEAEFYAMLREAIGSLQHEVSQLRAARGLGTDMEGAAAGAAPLKREIT